MESLPTHPLLTILYSYCIPLIQISKHVRNYVSILRTCDISELFI